MQLMRRWRRAVALRFARGDAMTAPRIINPVAWTGGTPPAPLMDIDRAERSMIKFFFSDQIIDWCDYWHDDPPRDVLRTFWIRARHDAHATRRAQKRSSKP
jgi:hypothetical protein